MNPYAELRRMQLEAERVLKSLAGLPRDPSVQAQAQRVGDLARRVKERAEAPVTIGLVGEFSVGKSQLLGRFLGLPALLLVSPEPTTGNVTAVHARPPGPGERPGDLEVSISYLSRETVAQAAAFILGELVALVETEGLPYDVRMLHGYNPVDQGWETFERLARAWWRGGEANLQLRQYAWELLKLRDALDVGSALLHPTRPGRPLVISAGVVKEAVEIGGSRSVPVVFPERRMAARAAHDAPLTAELLRDTFVLVRRVTYKVVVDSAHWSHGGFQHAGEVVFLDFPGLNALGCARDEFLCRLELSHLTSFVEVLAADRPETQVATKFATLLEGGRLSRERLTESVLIVANKFDKIAPVVPPSPAVASDLTDRSSELASLLRTVNELSRHQLRRVALTSAIPAVRHGEWAETAAALEVGGEHDLAEILRGYPADGGIGVLQQRLTRHLSEEALPIEVAEVTALRSELRAAWERLARMLRPAGGTVGEQDRRRLGDLIQALHRALDELHRTQRALLDPQALTVTDPDEQPTGLFDRIRMEAVLAVYAWPQWQPLVRGVKDGKVMPARQKQEPRSGVRIIRPSAPAPELADTAEQFRANFDRTMMSFEVRAQTLALEALERVLAEHTARCREAARLLQDSSTLLSSALDRLDPEDGGSVRLKNLGYIVDLSWVPQQFTDLLKGTETAGDNTFPLAPDQLMPWHPAFNDGNEIDQRRHHSRLHLLRHGTAEALAHPVRVGLAAAFATLNAVLDEQRDLLRQEIPTLSELLAAGPAPRADHPLDDPFDQ